MKVWRITQEQGSVSSYQAYLEQYPRGKYAYEAQVNILRLQKQEEIKIVRQYLNYARDAASEGNKQGTLHYLNLTKENSSVNVAIKSFISNAQTFMYNDDYEGAKREINKALNNL